MENERGVCDREASEWIRWFEVHEKKSCVYKNQRAEAKSLILSVAMIARHNQQHIECVNIGFMEQLHI